MVHEKKIFVKTYGCQMNEYDSGRIKDIMRHEGYSETDTEDDADMIVLNTCHIREKASEKVYSKLGRLKKNAIIQGKKPLIAVAGCVAQAEGNEILRRASNVDMVFGPQSYHKLPEFMAKIKTGNRVLETEFHENNKFTLPETQMSGKVTAFLSIQEGCDKFCSFCVVPYTRGAEFSRPVEDILKEAQKLVDDGIKEITLLGQNVNAYHGTNKRGTTNSLADLLHLLSNIQGLERLRYTTSHPCDMQEDLYEAHRDIDKLMPYLHLPVQAGSNRILKAMNRKHTAEDYIQIIDKMRKMRPDLAISGDFIVAFPSETEEDFEETLALVKKIGYASSFSFKYSPRFGTPAASSIQDFIPDDVATIRLTRLQDLLYSQQASFNSSLIGKKLDILVEKPGKYAGQLVGRSPYLQPVYFDGGNISIGDFVKIEIEGFSHNSLNGKVIDKIDYRSHHHNINASLQQTG